jgi:hypothetical protein
MVGPALKTVYNFWFIWSRHDNIRDVNLLALRLESLGPVVPVGQRVNTRWVNIGSRRAIK